MANQPAGPRNTGSRTASSLPNTAIVAYVMGEMNADHGEVHLEDLTHQCWQRYRARFSYSKYRDHMNVVVTRTALVDLRREGLAEAQEPTSDGLTLYKLTPAGRQWVTENGAWVKQALQQQNPEATKAMDKGAFQPARHRLERGSAAKKWQAGTKEAIDVWDFFEATRIDPLVPQAQARQIMTTLKMAVDGNDSLTALVAYLDETFGATYQTAARRGAT